MTSALELADEIERSVRLTISTRNDGRVSSTSLMPAHRAMIVAALRAAAPSPEPVAWMVTWPDGEISFTRRPTEYVACKLTALAPVSQFAENANWSAVEAIFDECAEIAEAHVGNVEADDPAIVQIYNEACRDIAEAIRVTASNRKTMDAIAKERRS